jgi:hypothetical protein
MVPLFCSSIAKENPLVIDEESESGIARTAEDSLVTLFD